jgi:uncharacterized coiled-coil DUF342 family protein
MSTHDDLIRRLRDPAYDASEEAADAIKELVAERDDMRALLRGLHDEVEVLVAERDQIKALYDAGIKYWDPVYKTILDERDTLRESVEKAEAERDAAHALLREAHFYVEQEAQYDLLARIDALLADKEGTT